MTTIPVIMPAMAICPSVFSYAKGSSSSKLINTMIPATNASEYARMCGEMNGNRIKIPINAPIGSAMPERNEYVKAFFLLPVA